MTAAILAAVLALGVGLVGGVVLGSAVALGSLGWLYQASDPDEWESVGGWLAVLSGANAARKAAGKREDA